MIQYRKIQIEKSDPFRKVCNKCGKSYFISDSDCPSFTKIHHTYGYGSKKDGDKYCSDVCESCMDEFYTTFVLPPQIIGTVVIGEDPGVPMVYVDETEERK